MVLIFLHQFRSALLTTLDRSLEVRAASSVAALREAAAPDFPDTQPSGSATKGTDAFTVVYDATGAVASAEPTGLPTELIPKSHRAAALKNPVRGDTTVSGARFRFYAVPVSRADGTWLVVAGASYRSTDQAVAAVTRVLMFGVPILLVLAGFGAWVLSGLSLRGVGRMRAEAADLGANDASGRVSEPSAKELKDLARTFNRLLDRLYQSLVHQRALVADAGHELRTPLTVLRTELELADKPGRSREALADSVNHARGEVDRLIELADSLLFLAQADRGDTTRVADPVKLFDIVSAAVRAHESRFALAQINLEQRCAVDLIVTADGRALRRAVDNLLSNALNNTPDRGTIRIDVDRTNAGSDVEIAVSDTGPGFPAEFLPYAFERFRKADAARTRAPGGGSGLGLAIVLEIATSHSGSATAMNLPEGGARVVIRIPISHRSGS